ncbi:hypothetical protein C5167_039800 [Papaver somniferum]|uniref:Uncharacterized protein n=1 Tax=Papaver somniferum TaxID=3469 RepID=A0A4Y7IFN0_PAPSO|nr:hypothetical protein C5167_039800 [Papaver somniferum]
MCGGRNGFLSFTASVQEGFGHVKAFFVGNTMKLMARNEKESSEADLHTYKMQVDATNAAEDTKKSRVLKITQSLLRTYAIENLTQNTTTKNDKQLAKHCCYQLIMDGIRNGFVSFTASVKKGFGYVKAFLVGNTMKLMARNEKELSEANLHIAQMQVDATNAAENTKKRIAKK